MQENKKINQKIKREREREREREITPPFFKGKLYKEWKREWQIYSKIVWTRKDKIREDEGKDEKWYQNKIMT